MKIDNLSSVQDYKYACGFASSDDFYLKGIDYNRSSYLALFDRFPAPERAGVHTFDVEYVKRSDRTLRVRVHNPTETGDPELLPCILYAHGGGFGAGNIDVINSICRDLALDLKVRVAAVEYRLAPEHQHPAALEDCLAAYLFLRENSSNLNIDLDRMYFAGESCGGSFSIGLPLMLRDKGLPQIAGSIAINPVLDVHRWANKQVTDCDQDFCDEMHFFTSVYLGTNDNVLVEYASPLLVDNVQGLPPAVFWACRADPLVADAEQFHAKLLKAGISSIIYVDDVAVHGSLRARYHYQFAHKGYLRLIACIQVLMSTLVTKAA